MDSGEEYQVYANWMHNNKLDNWQGWHCDAGYTRFYIDKNFDIWDGECKNKPLGNVLGDWATESNNVCKRITCTGCTDDLLTKKQRRD